MINRRTGIKVRVNSDIGARLSCSLLERDDELGHSRKPILCGYSTNSLAIPCTRLSEAESMMRMPISKVSESPTLIQCCAQALQIPHIQFEMGLVSYRRWTCTGGEVDNWESIPHTK